MTRIKNKYAFTYNVSEDKTKVYCMARPIQFDNKLIEARSIYWNLTGKPPRTFQTFDLVFVGKAEFKDGDTNDIETAKKIAKAKALRQANGVMASIIKEVETALLSKANYLTNVNLGTKRKSMEYAERVCELTKKV